MNKKTLPIILLIAIVISASFAVLSYNFFKELNTGGVDDSKYTIGVDVGNQAPNFSLTDIDGRDFQLDDFRGKVVVLDLMATWCGPCITEMGHLKELFKKYTPSEIVIISIDVDDTETVSQLRDFKVNYGDDWTFATGGGQVGQTYEATGIPKMFIIDQDGYVAFSNTGVTSSSALSKEIDKLL